MVAPAKTPASARRHPLSVAAGAIALIALALSLFPNKSWSQLSDYREAGSAPPHWIQFAKLVKYRFEDWISADEPVANRFRTYLRERTGKDDGPPQTLAVKAWLNPDGSVERVSFPSLNNPQANDDLNTILKRGNVGEAPPPEMLQPLNLRFSLNLK
jgi:hypothetical protein